MRAPASKTRSESRFAPRTVPGGHPRSLLRKLAGARLRGRVEQSRSDGVVSTLYGANSLSSASMVAAGPGRDYLEKKGARSGPSRTRLHDEEHLYARQHAAGACLDLRP